MIAVLNFCSHDRDQALRLLQWIATLGGVKAHDLILHFSQSVKRAENYQELVTEAERAFNSVSTVAVDGEEERGWPWSPNHAWMNALRIIREKIMKPWMWLEPDCCPLTSDWLDRIEAEYTAAGKPFMGAEVRRNALRMSGIGVYPPMVVSYLVKKRLPDLFVRKEAFDAYFATEIVPHAHFTKLIQEVLVTSRDPDVLPTFPDAASLSLLSTAAVLFHRCKDSTLIDRLTQRLPASMPAVEVLSQGAGFTSPPVVTITESGPTREELMAEIERLRAQPPLRKRGVPMRKGHRTPEQQAAINARMAKARAGRKKVTT